MPHLKFHGRVLKQYHGIDQDTVVVAGPGDVIHVSEHKAERLLKDFPTEFEVHHTGGDDIERPSTEPTESQDSEFQSEAKDVQPPRNKMVVKARKKKWR